MASEACFWRGDIDLHSVLDRKNPTSLGIFRISFAKSSGYIIVRNSLKTGFSND
jgi:hypothetical protein